MMNLSSGRISPGHPREPVHTVIPHDPGYRPVIAIGEAKQKAQAWGLLVFTLEPGDNLPFHFLICSRECISLVRVRRLKYPSYDVAAIGQSCRNEIELLRALPVTREISGRSGCGDRSGNGTGTSSCRDRLKCSRTAMRRITADRRD